MSRDGAGAAEEPSLFSVAVALHSRDRSTLLALASVLHRRAVDVLDAQLTWVTEDTRAFEATISGTARQAATVERTMRNLVFVTDVHVASVEPPLGGRGQ